MARQITKKRGKSSIKTRLEQERKAGRKDPKGKKSVVSKAAIASLAIPGSAAVKVGAKAAKVAKVAKAAKAAKVAKAAKEKKAVDKYRKRDAIERVGAMADGERGPMTLSNKKAILRDLKKKDKARNAIKKPKAFKDTRSAKEKLQQNATDKFWAIQGYNKEGRTEDAIRLIKERKALLKQIDKMKKGGIVKKHRGDGIAKRGRTKGRII